MNTSAPAWRPRQQPARRAGFTLLELTVVLGIIALMAAAIMRFFGSASEGQKTDDVIFEIASVQAAVHSIYSGQTTYGNIDISSIISKSRQLPAKWSNPAAGTMWDAYGGTVFVTPAYGRNDGTTFSIVVNGLSFLACTKLVSSDFGPSLIANDFNGLAYNVPASPYAPSVVAANCQSNQANWAMWEFM